MKTYYKLLACLLIFGFSMLNVTLVNAQGNCNTGGCSGGASYGGALSTTSSTFVSAMSCTYGGEYNTFNVTSGATYEWSMCPGDGAAAGFSDDQLTLRTTGGTNLCYSDDYCGLHARIQWVATFTGQVQVLLNQYNCASASVCNTMVWRQAAPPGPPPILGQCLSGGCSGGAAYGSALSTSSEYFVQAMSCTYGGEYNTFNVTSGNTYEWSMCPADGATAGFSDDQLTLRTTGGTNLCYSDDYCGAHAHILWVATFTGQVQVLLNQYNCASASVCNTMVWRQAAVPSCSTPTVSVSPTSSSVCGGASVTLTASGDATSYTWSPATGLNTTTGAVVIATPATTTTYTVTGSVSGGCAATATAVITVTPVPVVTATATPSTVCTGGTTQLCAAITTSSTQVYNIALGNLLGISNNCGNGSYYNNCGSQQPGFTWTDAGSGAVASVSVQFSIGVTCANGLKNVSLNGVAQSSTFTDSYFCDCSNPGLAANTFTLSLSPANYTVGGANTFLITNPTSCLGFYPGISSFYARVTVVYGGTSCSASGGATFSWTPSGDLSDATAQSPVASNITSTTTYEVTATNNGCS
ncbi:MAG: hypothetical protein JJE25_10015, partial [Bacteroidia bacterium]|nr:hypothetical protein [Bacteroidia bacterium]